MLQIQCYIKNIVHDFLAFLEISSCNVKYLKIYFVALRRFRLFLH